MSEFLFNKVAGLQDCCKTYFLCTLCLSVLSQPLPLSIIRLFVSASPPYHWFSAEYSHGSPFCSHKVSTPVPPFPHPKSPSFCGTQLTSPSHNLLIPLPIDSTCQFQCEKTVLIQFLRGFKPGLQQWELAILANMLSFTVVWKIPELMYCYQPSPALTLDIFLFPVTTLNNFLCPTMPQHSAVSTLGRIAPHPSLSCLHPMEVSWPLGNCPDYPNIPLPFTSELTSNRSPHREQKRFTSHPQQSMPTHTSATAPTPSISPILQEPADVTIK